MDPAEGRTFAFIVRVWIEDADEPGRAVWHGHVTHVPGNQRRYVNDLNAVCAFIAAYLREADVQMSPRTPARKWLDRLTGGPRR